MFGSLRLDESVPFPLEDGSYWRIPASTNAVRFSGHPSEIRTDISGVAISPSDQIQIELQNFATSKAGRDVTKDFKVIFFPNQLGLKLLTFGVVMWLGLLCAIWVSFVFPIRAGRLIFRLVYKLNDVHDAYSWLLSLYILWFFILCRRIILRETRRWTKYLESKPHRRIRLNHFRSHNFDLFFNPLYATLTIFIIIPTLMGVVVEVYFVLPLKYYLHPLETPNIRITEVWAAGLIIGLIVTYSERAFPINGMGGMMAEVT